MGRTDGSVRVPMTRAEALDFRDGLVDRLQWFDIQSISSGNDEIVRLGYAAAADALRRRVNRLDRQLERNAEGGRRDD